MKKRLFITALLVLVTPLQAQTQSPEQVLAAMEKCREQVINQLSFGEKMKMRAAMNAIQSNPKFMVANKTVTDATTPEAQVAARKNLAKVKLDLIEQQDPSLKPVVDKIRTAGYYNTTSVNGGPQMGAQTFSYALFFMTKEDLQNLNSSGGFNLGAAPSLTVADKGVASTSSLYTLHGIKAFIFGQKGLMAGVGLSGTKISQYTPSY